MTPAVTSAPFPKTIIAIDKSHLELLIRQNQEKYTNACDLNHIDVSRVTDMKKLFAHSFFTGDISSWDVSSVTDMDRMFSGSVFNGNIAGWDVSNVRCMNNMFSASHFNGDVSHWNTSSVESMDRMFQTAHFNAPIDGWNVGRCTDFSSMFADSRFNQDISGWDMRCAQQVGYMFYDCPFAHDVSRWDLPLSCRMLNMFSSASSGFSMGVKVQRPADWHAKLHLDNGSLPPPELLLDAFNELRSIHETLGSSNEERARDLVHMVVAKRLGKGAGPAGGESWAIDGLVG